MIIMGQMWMFCYRIHNRLMETNSNEICCRPIECQFIEQKLIQKSLSSFLRNLFFSEGQTDDKINVFHQIMSGRLFAYMSFIVYVLCVLFLFGFLISHLPSFICHHLNSKYLHHMNVKCLFRLCMCIIKLCLCHE